MPPAAQPATTPSPRRRTTPAPPRRRQVVPVPSYPVRRRLITAAVVFMAIVLATDALIGEKGLVQTVRARKEASLEESRLAALKQENARLRELKRRLNEDPEMIEAEARRQLGLVRPGEVMFILKDVRPADVPRASSTR